MGLVVRLTNIFVLQCIAMSRPGAILRKIHLLPVSFLGSNDRRWLVVGSKRWFAKGWRSRLFSSLQYPLTLSYQSPSLNRWKKCGPGNVKNKVQCTRKTLKTHIVGSLRNGFKALGTWRPFFTQPFLLFLFFTRRTNSHVWEISSSTTGVFLAGPSSGWQRTPASTMSPCLTPPTSRHVESSFLNHFHPNWKPTKYQQSTSRHIPAVLKTFSQRDVPHPRSDPNHDMKVHPISHKKQGSVLAIFLFVLT